MEGAEGDEAMRIAFFGDSLTEGVPGVSVLGKLRAMLPEHELENHGRRGDTVMSLYRRIAQGRHRGRWDAAVLWVGVNDTLAKLSVGHSVLKRLMNQPAAENLLRFRDDYRRTVELLLENSARVFVVSPLFIGEELSNPWNKELGDLSTMIASVAASFDTVDFIDLRSRLSQRLATCPSSDYLPHRVSAIVCDTLFLRTPRAVDSVALGRGLRLTLDGVHLNSAGATAVAEVLWQSLRALS